MSDVPPAPGTAHSAKLRLVCRREGKKAWPSHRYDTLPFVDPGKLGEQRNFWAPRPTGDYTFDCTLGERYAEAMLPMLREAGGAILLGCVALAIADSANGERDRGVIVGMFGAIGRAMERPVREAAE